MNGGALCHIERFDLESRILKRYVCAYICTKFEVIVMQNFPCFNKHNNHFQTDLKEIEKYSFLFCFTKISLFQLTRYGKQF